jgi:hypothetical protein
MLFIDTFTVRYYSQDTFTDDSGCETYIEDSIGPFFSVEYAARCAERCQGTIYRTVSYYPMGRKGN